MIRRILARLLDPGLEHSCRLAAAHIELSKQARASALADVAAILNCGATLAEIDEAVRGLQEGAGRCPHGFVVVRKAVPGCACCGWPKLRGATWCTVCARPTK